MSHTLVADVGRTHCRVARFEGSRRVATAQVPSGASLADPDGATRLTAAVHAAFDLLPSGPPPRTVVVGTTGVAQVPSAGDRLAEALGHSYPNTDVLIASDVLTAHLGALDGEPGVCLVAGSGAVALAIPAAAPARIVDGHGYLLGDGGSGFSVGRAGLVAALRHHDGRDSGSSRLAEAAVARFGPLGRLPGMVQSDPDAVRRIAAFAVDVASAARAGDPVASGIWSDAVAALADTAVAACRYVDAPVVPVGLAGSLMDLDDLVTAPLTAAITAACPGARPERARGDALTGARHLAGPLPALDAGRLQRDGLLRHVGRGTARSA